MELVEYQLMDALEQEFWWYRGLHAVIVERLLQLNLPAQAKVLDAGCGTGGMLVHWQHVAPHYAYAGLEWHSEAAAMAEKKTGLPIVRGSVNALPYADGEFAAIFSQDVICHRNVDEAAMLRECRRCLQSGGHLLLNVAAYQWMTSAHDVHVHADRRYTTARLHQLLHENGFEIVETGYWNSLLFPLMVLHRMTVGKNKTESDVAPLPAWQNRLFFGILDRERRWHLRLPFGGSAWIHGRKR